MKAFEDLQREVHEPGLCRCCGGCVAYCSALNFGAIGMGSEGPPRYVDADQCVECGVCYAICPATAVFDEAVRKRLKWREPVGNVLSLWTGQARDSRTAAQGTDGGVATALLAHLLERGAIDGAVLARREGIFSARPVLASDRESILASAGSALDLAPSMGDFGGWYGTFSDSLRALGRVREGGFERLAFVGTGCQVMALRKMEAYGVMPSESIALALGLFCSGSFLFGPREREILEHMGNFRWESVRKLNLREEFQIHLRSGETRFIPLDAMEFALRPACRFCGDYSAEYADLSFGGLGSEEGWTTAVARTPAGRFALAAAVPALELRRFGDTEALERIVALSQWKRARAARWKGSG